MSESDWSIIVNGLQDITRETPMTVALVVIRTAAVMGNAAIRITKEQEDSLTAVKQRVVSLEREIVRLHHDPPVKARRKRGKK